MKIQQVGINGTPDVLMCLCGIFVAIELKTDEGDLSKLQLYNLAKITECGGTSMVMTPENMEDCFLYLESFAREAQKHVKPHHIIM